MTDAEIFFNFAQAAQEVLRAGLRFSQREDPTLFLECAQALRTGRARARMTIEFEPVITVSLELIGELEGERGEKVAEVFRFVARPAAPAERPD